MGTNLKNIINVLLIIASLHICSHSKPADGSEWSREGKFLQLLSSLSNPFSGPKLLLFRKPLATATIVRGSSNAIAGTLNLYKTNGGVAIMGKIVGLTTGNHGFHVHENAATTNNCVDAGGHFNPTNTVHGDRQSSIRHVGDLGNIVADRNGIANINIVDTMVSLDPNSAHNIVGKTFVIHADADDLGVAGTTNSMTTGSAGARLGCGIIHPVETITNPLFASLVG